MSVSQSFPRRVGVAATMLVALLPAACTEVGPTYVRPSVSVPGHFKESEHAASRESFRAPTDAWWTVYGDPVLDQLVEAADADNQTLASASARVRQADALVHIARSAESPTVAVGTIKSGRRNENDFGLGVNWELDLWGRIRRDVEAHRADAEASAADREAVALSMRAQLVVDYFALRETDAVLSLQEGATDADAQWERMAQNQFAQGLTSSADVAQALMRSSASQLQLANLRASRAELEHAIAVLVGKAPADFALVRASGETDIPVVPEGVPASLLARRPDVAARERRMAAASARIGVSKAETLPSINLAAGIGVLRGPTATADARAPLFTGGRLQANVDASAAAYDAAVADYRQTVLDAYREVEDALARTHALEGAVPLQTHSAVAAAESERVVRNQYREGIADFTAVVDASNAALSTGRDAIQLHRQRLEASVMLIKALGGNWGDSAAVPAAGAVAP